MITIMVTKRVPRNPMLSIVPPDIVGRRTTTPGYRGGPDLTEVEHPHGGAGNHNAHPGTVSQRGPDRAQAGPDGKLGTREDGVPAYAPPTDAKLAL